MNAANPDLISVIIPTYNRADLLLEALTSVRRQTWPHVQIIVVDDGSTDRTSELMTRMPDVRYVRQDHQGQGAARNLGLRHANGAFVSTLDSDDLWEPDFLESCLHALRTLKTDFVFSNWTVRTSDGGRHPSEFEAEYGWSDYSATELEGWRVIEPPQARTSYVNACISPSSSLLLPRELLPHGWSEEPIIADDWYLLLHLVLTRPCRVAVSTRPRWLKRIVGDNICDGRDSMEIKNDLCVHDYRLFLNDFSSLLEAHERASLYTRLGGHQAILAKWELTRRRLAPSCGLLLGAAACLTRAFFLSPGVVLWFVRKLISRLQRHHARRQRSDFNYVR